MYKKITLLITLGLLSQAAPLFASNGATPGKQEKPKDLKADLLDVVPVKTVQEIIWGYLYKWELKHEVKEPERSYRLDISFRPDGKNLAAYSACPTNHMQLIDAQTGNLDEKAVSTLLAHPESTQEAGNFVNSPDGNYFAYNPSHNKLVHVVEADTGKTVAFIHPQAKSWVLLESYSPRGSYVRLGSSEVIELWDAKRYIYLKTLKNNNSPLRKFSSSALHSSANLFSPDEKYTISIDRECGPFRPESADIETKAWAMQIWDIQSGTVIQEIKNHDIYVAAWSPNGQYIATGSQDGTIKLWQKTHDAFEFVRVFKNSTAITESDQSLVVVQLIWSQDSRYIFVAQGMRAPIHVYEVKTGNCIDAINDEVKTICYAQDGSQIAVLCFGGNIKIYRNQLVDIEFAQTEKNNPVSKPAVQSSDWSCTIS